MIATIVNRFQGLVVFGEGFPTQKVGTKSRLSVWLLGFLLSVATASVGQAQDAVHPSDVDFVVQDSTGNQTKNLRGLYLDSVACQRDYPEAAPYFCLNIYPSQVSYRSRNSGAAVFQASYTQTDRYHVVLERPLSDDNGTVPLEIPVYYSNGTDGLSDMRRTLLADDHCTYVMEGAEVATARLISFHTFGTLKQFDGLSFVNSFAVCSRPGHSAVEQRVSDLASQSSEGQRMLSAYETLIQRPTNLVQLVATFGEDNVAAVAVLIFSSSDASFECDPEQSGLPQTFLYVSPMCRDIFPIGATPPEPIRDRSGAPTSQLQVPLVYFNTGDSAQLSGSLQLRLVIGTLGEVCVLDFKAGEQQFHLGDFSTIEVPTLGGLQACLPPTPAVFWPTIDGAPVSLGDIRFVAVGEDNVEYEFGSGFAAGMQIIGGRYYYASSQSGRPVAISEIRVMGDRRQLGQLDLSLFENQEGGPPAQILIEVPRTSLSLAEVVFVSPDERSSDAFTDYCVLIIENGTGSEGSPEFLLRNEESDYFSAGTRAPVDAFLFLSSEFPIWIRPHDSNVCPGFEQEVTWAEFVSGTVLLNEAPAPISLELAFIISSHSRLSERLQDDDYVGADFAQALIGIVNELSRSGTYKWDDVSVSLITGQIPSNMARSQTGGAVLEMSPQDLSDLLIVTAISNLSIPLKTDIRGFDDLEKNRPNVTAVLIGYVTDTEDLCADPALSSIESLHAARWEDQRILVFLLNIHKQAGVEQGEVFQKCTNTPYAFPKMEVYDISFDAFVSRRHTNFISSQIQQIIER